MPKQSRGRIVKKFRTLEVEPRPVGVEKVTSRALYRIGQGDTRVLYEVSDREKSVTTIKIGHRREVYR